MYSFFLNFDGTGIPSYSKFARSVGTTLEILESFRKNRKFDEAFRECGEIRRDYLIDGALTKRYDSSFSKFLLSSEFGMGDDDEPSREGLAVTLEVIE